MARGKILTKCHVVFSILLSHWGGLPIELPITEMRGNHRAFSFLPAARAEGRVAKEPSMPCSWLEYELFYGPENAGKVIHPSLDIAQFEILDSTSLSPAQLRSLEGRQLSLTWHSGSYVFNSRCFDFAETQAAEQFVKIVQGKTMKQVEELVGIPSDKAGPVVAWGDDAGAQNWLYYLGYSKQALLLKFENDLCRNAKILTEQESNDAWFRRVKQMYKFGMPEKEFLHQAGPPQAVLLDQFGRTVYQYKVGPCKAQVDVPVKNGRVCPWRGMNVIMGWGASCEQMF